MASLSTSRTERSLLRRTEPPRRRTLPHRPCSGRPVGNRLMIVGNRACFPPTHGMIDWIGHHLLSFIGCVLTAWPCPGIPPAGAPPGSGPFPMRRDRLPPLSQSTRRAGWSSTPTTVPFMPGFKCSSSLQRETTSTRVPRGILIPSCVLRSPLWYKHNRSLPFLLRIESGWPAATP